MKANPRKTRSKSKTKTNKRFRSRSSSKETFTEKRIKREQPNIETIKRIEEDCEFSNDEEFPYKTFKGLSMSAVDEIVKIPGVKIKEKSVDESNVTMVTLDIDPDDHSAFNKVFRILDTDPLIQITPSVFLDEEFKQYQFSVHKSYSTLTSQECKKNPVINIPNAFQGVHQVNLFCQFRSALVASLYEIKRFQSNNNPGPFNDIPHGTLLGEMTFIYGGRRSQLLLGPLKYYR